MGTTNVPPGTCDRSSLGQEGIESLNVVEENWFSIGQRVLIYQFEMWNFGK